MVAKETSKSETGEKGRGDGPSRLQRKDGNEENKF